MTTVDQVDVEAFARGVDEFSRRVHEGFRNYAEAMAAIKIEPVEIDLSGLPQCGSSMHEGSSSYGRAD